VKQGFTTCNWMSIKNITKFNVAHVPRNRLTIYKAFHNVLRDYKHL
jgi:hypothetical protein